MLNPYQDVDWSSARRVPSATHMHLECEEHLQNAYRHGIRHFAVTNYYPSVPRMPGWRASDYRLRQDWPVRRDGQELDLPVNWNDVIDWKDELEAPYRDQLPFTETEPIFTDVPSDTVWSPNTEHHGFTDSAAHITSPGSSFRSGTFDCRDEFVTHSRGFPCGYGGPWRDAFQGMLDELVYPDGGGVIINHPTWFTRLSDEQVCEMLDYDPRVLGIEIYNDYSRKRDWENLWGGVVFAEGREEPEKGFSLALWDRLLSTGRRVWGFCVPDHSAKTANWPGRSILLVDEFSDRACLQAYRRGAFIGCLYGEGVQVESLEVTEEAIVVTLDEPATTRFITQDGCVMASEGTSTGYRLNPSRPDTYVRIEISHADGERLFLQPILYSQ